jgi:hypothetical protein
MTEDLILLSRVEEKLDALTRKLGEVDLEIKELDRRLRRVERAHPGGRWAKTVERIVLGALTLLLGYRTISPDGEAVLRPPVIEQPLHTTTSTR